MLVKLFSTPIYKTKVDIDFTVKNKLEETPFERSHHNHCFISKNNYVLNDDYFKKFNSVILQNVNNFLFNELMIENNILPVILNSWIVKHEYNDYAPTHFHCNSFLSGIFYLKCDQDSGRLCFVNPLSNTSTSFSSIPLHFNYSKFNEVNSEEWCFIPEELDLFLFPSNLKHYVTQCFSEERIVLAFNVGLCGDLSNNRLSYLTLNMS
jgi:uncharacterized protein (TIGR02466 family)